MKKNIAILLIALGFFPVMQSNAIVATPSPSFIIGDDLQMIVVPDDHMNALFVVVELILEDGSIYAQATTSPGKGVSFGRAGIALSKVRMIYHLSVFESIIIDDDAVIS